MQKQDDEKKDQKKNRKEIRKIKGDKEVAGFDNQNARKIAIRSLLIVSIDHFQNNMRLIRLRRTTFHYECNLRKFKLILSKGKKSPIKKINPKVHQRLLTPHRLMVISWSRKVMSFCYGYILMKVNLRVVDWRRQARSKLKKPN